MLMKYAHGTSKQQYPTDYVFHKQLFPAFIGGLGLGLY